MGSHPLSLALSVTNTHALLSLLVRPLSLPLLSWLLPCPLPLPGYPPLSPPPPPSWQSLDPAKQKQKSVSSTAFYVSLPTLWDELGGPSNTHSHICPHFLPPIPGSPSPPLPSSFIPLSESSATSSSLLSLELASHQQTPILACQSWLICVCSPLPSPPWITQHKTGT